jgi:hypothetical protein
MRKDYEKLFIHLEPPEPPAELLGRIMARIHEEERLKSIKKRLFLFSTTVLVSAIAFIPATNAFWDGFAQSGFLQFISLLFSDFGLIIDDWQNFGLAILESLPVMSITAFLFTAFISLWSLKHLVQAIKVVFNQPQLKNYGLQ